MSTIHSFRSPLFVAYACSLAAGYVITGNSSGTYAGNFSIAAGANLCF